jgi:glycosyltransferase involved in cell wall biosynthesis
MNVLLAAAGDVQSNSALHTFSVARVMLARGVDCVVTCGTVGHAAAMREGVMFADGRGPDLIHAWTPREHVRRLTERMVERYGCPYIVHLEDNEEVILADMMRPIGYRDLARLPARVTDVAMPPGLSHPKRYRWFLEGAAGVTALIDRLLEFKPEGTPGVVFWPGFETGILQAGRSRETYGVKEGEAVVVYNGNIHRSNEEEVVSLIDAVALLNARGVRVKLLKTGSNHAGMEKLKEAEERGFLVNLGFLPRAEIYSILNMADVLVQPGRESAFNDYRFPCKLPEFLATGRPVILPKANLGRYLRDSEECLLLETGDAAEIADKVQRVLEDRGWGERMGQAGREFAMRELDWERNLEPVLELYRQVTGGPDRQVTGGPARVRVMRDEDELPVALHRVAGGTGMGDQPYLEAAVRANAAGSLRVTQRGDGDPWLYQKWLAAAVERAMSRHAPAIDIECWREDAAWVAATRRGYAAGLGQYLRRAGLPISNMAVEQALAGGA